MSQAQTQIQSQAAASSSSLGLSRILALLVLGAGLVCDAVGLYYLPGARAHDAINGAAALTGIGLAWVLLSYRSSVGRAFEDARVYYALVAGLAVSLPLILYWCGMRQFGGFDQSVLIDAGWRYHIGQRPGVDFPSTVPLGFLLGAGYAYSLFGVSWSAIVIFSALFCVVTFFWSLALFRELLDDRALALLLALGFEAMCLIYASYWWYNPIAVAAGVIFTLSALLCLNAPRSVPAWISYFVALMLVATMKPNIAGLLILLITAILLTSREHRWKVLLVSLLAFVTLNGILWLQGINLLACMRDFRGVAGRGLTAGLFFTHLLTGRFEIGPEQVLAILAMLLVLVLFAAAFRRSAAVRANLRALGICGACLLAAVNSFITAGDLKSPDVGMALIAAMLACNATGGLKSPFVWPPLVGRSNWITGYAVTLLLVLTCLGFGTGASRHRVFGIGLHMFFEYKLDPEPFTSGFFRGLHTSQNFKEVYAQTEKLVNETEDKRLFFGPRMQWAYAAFRLPAPQGEPILWVPAVSYDLRDEQMLLARFLEHRNLLVFWHNDMTFFSQVMVDLIASRYEVEEQRFPDLTIYRQKQ